MLLLIWLLVWWVSDTPDIGERRGWLVFLILAIMVELGGKQSA